MLYQSDTLQKLWCEGYEPGRSQSSANRAQSASSSYPYRLKNIERNSYHITALRQITSLSSLHKAPVHIFTVQANDRHSEAPQATSACETSFKDVPASKRCILMATMVLTSLVGPTCNARAATAPSGGGRYLGGLRNAKTPRTTRESTQVSYARGAKTDVVTSLRR